MERKNHLCEDRLIYLHGIKTPLLKKQPIWKESYIGTDLGNRDPYKSNYSSNIAFTIINNKASEILAGIQEYDFIPQDGDAQKNVKLIEKIWEYEWINSGTDKEISKGIYSGLKYGDGFIYEGTRKIERKVKDPIVKKDGTIGYKERTLVIRDGIYTEFIPWENFYYDGYDIDDANEAVWIKYWDRDDFLNTFGNNKNYSLVNEALPFGMWYSITSDTLKINSSNTDRIISELRYYNKSRDELIILANGIEVYRSIIPYKHKELPFAVFSDYHLEDRTYNMGEYELLEKDIAYKDALRALNIDIIKAQMGFTVIDPLADFDEATIEIGTNSFARISPEDIKHFAPNINSSNILQAEINADNDIIIKSGVDFKSQLLGPGETATKTSSKNLSARKRINLNLKLNGYTFFARLAKLRMSNIQLEYGQKQKKIPVKGMNINSDGVSEAINGGYGTFTTKPAFVKGSFNILPITESILGISTEKDKIRLLEFYQLVGDVVGEDGKPVIKAAMAVEDLARKFGVDFERLTQKTEAYQSPDKMLEDIQTKENGNPTSTSNPANPQFIPPEQRSGATKNFGAIGGINSLPIE